MTIAASDALTLRRAHLDQHRRSIIGRSLAAAVAGAVPVPMLDDWLVYMLLRGTFHKIARDHQIDLDEDAVRNLVQGRAAAPSIKQLATSTVIARIVAKGWRKLLVTYLATRRIQSAGDYFLRATMFDHYCARLHVGLGMDGEAALELWDLMDEALRRTPGGLSRRMLRRSIVAAARATVRAPFELVDIVSRGALRRFLDRRKGSEGIAAAEEVDAMLEQHLATEGSFLARATAAVEAHLSAQGNPYMDALIDNFERLWRHRGHP